SGDWSMYDRSTGTLINAPHDSLTLDAWLADGTWGALLSGATIVDVQLGIGSGNADTVGYVDWLETNVIAGGERINFQAVPEPSTVVLLGLAGVAGLAIVRRRRQG